MRSARNATTGDPPKKILDNLPAEYADQIPKEFYGGILDKARETFRTVRVKAIPGRQMCQGDCDETRYAAVMEYILRQGISTKNGKSFSIVIPLKVLGKLVGKNRGDTENVSSTMNRLYFMKWIDTPKSVNSRNSVSRVGKVSRKRSRGEKLSQKMGMAEKNVRTSLTKSITAGAVSDKTSKAPSKKASSKRNVTARNLKQPKTESSTMPSSNASYAKTMQELIQPKQLHDLCIKLQSKLHDPDTCEKYSTSLFYQIVAFKHDNERFENTKRAVISDFHVNKIMYDGCCFFLSAKETEYGPLVSCRGTTVSKRQLLEAVINPDGEGNTDMMNSLVIEDVANVLRVESSAMKNFLGVFLEDIREMRIQNLHNSTKSKEEIANIPIKRPKRMAGGKKRESQIVASRATIKTEVKQESTATLVTSNSHVRVITEAIKREERIKDYVTDTENSEALLREPCNCKPQFKNKANFDKWRENLFRSLNISELEDGRQDTIEKLASAIINKHAHAHTST